MQKDVLFFNSTIFICDLQQKKKKLYFSCACRNMLHGPWKEAGAPVVNLHVDDKNVNGEAIAIALAYLYGHHPKLSDDNAFRVLAAASFLDLQVW